VEDVRASGDGVRGELCPADLRNILVREKRKSPPARQVAWSDYIFMSSLYVDLSVPWKRNASPKRSRWVVVLKEIQDDDDDRCLKR